MRVCIALAVALLTAPPAVADDGAFGTPWACFNLGASPDTGAEPFDDIRPFFFDGEIVYGPDWSCEVATGVCEGEGEEWQQAVSVTVGETGAAVTIDGDTTALPPCP